MGDVIQFKPRRKIEVKVEGQLLLEVAIVKLWERVEGMDLITSVPEYHILFLQFSDLCFQLITAKEIIVSQDGEIQLTDKATNKLKEFIVEKGY